jgi:hypothetical protein
MESPGPEDFHDPRLLRLLRYWESKCCGAEAPPVAAIDPVEFRFILGWLMIMEPLDGGANFRYRLYGSHIADAFGRDLTDCRIGDSFPAVASFVIGVYQQILRRKRPILTRHTPPAIIPIQRWERLVLPFLGPDGNVTRILVGAIAHGIRRVDRPRPPWPLNDAAETEGDPPPPHPSPPDSPWRRFLTRWKRD